MKQVYYAPQTCRRPSLGHCDCHCHTPPAHPGLQEKGGFMRTSSMHNVGAGFGGVACDILYRVACVRAQETSYVSVSYIPSRSSDFLLLAAGSESSPVGQHAERVTPSKHGGGQLTLVCCLGRVPQQQGVAESRAQEQVLFAQRAHLREKRKYLVYLCVHWLCTNVYRCKTVCNKCSHRRLAHQLLPSQTKCSSHLSCHQEPR